MASDISNLGSYSPEDVLMVISWNAPGDSGSHILSGTAEGTFIVYERTVPRATLYVGSDLSAARTLRRNKSGTITVTLMQGSESNDILSELARKDEEARNNDYLLSITLKDTFGRTMLFAPQAFLGNDPSISFGTDYGTRDWTFEVLNVQRHFGGDSKFTPENEATLTSLGYTVEDKWKS